LSCVEDGLCRPPPSVRSSVFLSSPAPIARSLSGSKADPCIPFTSPLCMLSCGKEAALVPLLCLSYCIQSVQFWSFWGTTTDRADGLCLVFSVAEHGRRRALEERVRAVQDPGLRVSRPLHSMQHPPAFDSSFHAWRFDSFGEFPGAPLQLTPLNFLSAARSRSCSSRSRPANPPG